MKRILVLAVIAFTMNATAQSIGNAVAKTAATTATKEVIKGVSKEITTPPKKLVINETTKTIDLDAPENNTPTYTATGYTAISKGVSYPVYQSKKGRKFIFLTSKTSGKEYRKYIE